MPDGALLLRARVGALTVTLEGRDGLPAALPTTDATLGVASVGGLVGVELLPAARVHPLAAAGVALTAWTFAEPDWPAQHALGAAALLQAGAEVTLTPALRLGVLGEGARELEDLVIDHSTDTPSPWSGALLVGLVVGPPGVGSENLAAR